ncbi:MAG: 50S ribosomal protein L9, partial [Chloroflexi bacterium]|nr:50S ribosomal protein L9 [Chloroflexota bacterium]
MKVLFLDDIPQVADAGQVKEVAAGYARNFLLPRGLAVAATRGREQDLDQQRQAITRRKAKVAA